ncbi:PvdJ/PvdD/PvdP-like protein, partial [Pseudomonas savastanoi]
ALTGAAVPAAYYAHREFTRVEEPVTPGEATAGPADTSTQRLADKLRGVWTLRFEGRDAGLADAPLEGLEMFLDIAPRGRGLRGYIDTPEQLRSDAQPRFRVIGDLQPANAAKLYLRVMDGHAGNDPHSDTADYEFSLPLDEVWGAFGNAGSGTLSGRIERLDRPLALPELENRLIAIKQVFPEARERVGLSPPFLAWLVSKEHRLFHQLWHASRDKWHKLPEDKRNALRGIGWQPGPREKERDARGPHKDRNGSGEDFFYMHRHMLIQARKIQDLPSWPRFPLPQPELERDRLGFARYFDNHDGCSLPPNWLAQGDEEYTQLVSDIKSHETFHTHFQVWESQYRDPRFLSKLTLGQFGSQVELELHDWLHMRWASVARDP